MARGRRRGRKDDNRGFEENVININRVATVVKGGRRFSFNCLVVVGDGKGQVGYGFGKANEVPLTVQKAVKDAHKNLIKVPIVDGDTVPHVWRGRFGASKVLLIPAHPGTGIVAGPSVRAVLSVCGIKNILTKSLGSHNPVNLVKATFNALKNMRTREEAEAFRGVSLDVDSYEVEELKEHTPKKSDEGGEKKEDKKGEKEKKEVKSSEKKE